MRSTHDSGPHRRAAHPQHDRAAPPGESPELRPDPLFDRMVFVAPRRAGRPNEFEGDRVTCPFCAGNERATPREVLRSPAAETEPWRVRIVPNRFPFVPEGMAPSRGVAATRDHDCDSTSGGVHEVVIESPRHVGSILAIDPPGWHEAWDLCRRRLEHLAQRDDIAWATVFKNSGVRAGASLEHVHSQLVGLSFVPPAIRSELAATRRAVDLFGMVLERALLDGRIVEEGDGLVTIVPPAPRQPFEAWILPQQPEKYFHTAGPARVAALAALTRSFVARLERLAPAADYNWWLHEPPYPRWAAVHGGAMAGFDPAGPRPPDASGGRALAAGWRWHLEILPRFNGFAGFELGAGCHVTTVGPEESARLLREAA